MHGYSIDGWDSFFVAGTGAAAALTGLVFVALSINLTPILSAPGLPDRAGETIAMLTEALLISLLGLVPQTSAAFAVELTVLGVVGWVLALVLFVRRPRNVEGPTNGQQVGQFVLGQMATLPVIVAGISLWVGAGGGLYWLVVGILFLLVNGIANAWVLLVEILR